MKDPADPPATAPFVLSGLEETPPPWNPQLHRGPRRRRRLAADQYVRGITEGNRTVLAQAITLIESSHPADTALAEEIVERCLPRAGRSTRVGVTGVPGVGKSTFLDALGLHVLGQGHRVAVLAVDPSSEISGGSILGDKTRMRRLAADARAFIRPSPAGGSLGGVARHTRETMLLCEAAGFDVVFIETVGVGQSETAVHSMVDFFLLLMLAGAGDELQGIKRGIIEMTDLVAINKADGANREAALRAQRDYGSALRLFPRPPSGWEPRVVCCSAATGDGITGIWRTILDHQELVRANGWFERRRSAQRGRWMEETILQSLVERFRRDARVREPLQELEAAVRDGRSSPFRAARLLLDLYFGPQSGS